MPLIPILIGVIVLGFVIGAGLSIARRHGATQNVALETAPTQRAATEAPVTPAPTERPTRTPTDAPQALATGAPTDVPSAEPSHVASDASTARPSRSASPGAARSPAAATPRTAAATPRTAAATPRTAAATPRGTAATPAATPAAKRSAAAGVALAPVAQGASDAPASADDVDTDFGRLASAVVRQYLGAIARGDEATAYAAFGAASGDAGVHLTETGIVGPSAHIQHVEVRGAGDNATVNVDLKTPSGLYFGQYTVHRTGSGAALIVDHSIVKP